MGRNPDWWGEGREELSLQLPCFDSSCSLAVLGFLSRCQITFLHFQILARSTQSPSKTACLSNCTEMYYVNSLPFAEYLKSLILCVMQAIDVKHPCTISQITIFRTPFPLSQLPCVLEVVVYIESLTS